MSLQPLIEELKKPEYDGKSAEECAELINAKVIVVRKPVPVVKIRKAMIERGIWAELVDESTAADNGSKRKLAITILALVDTDKSGLTVLDLDSYIVQELLDGLVFHKFCTEDERQEVVNSAEQTVKWTQHVGLGEVGIGYINLARQQG